MVYEDYDEREYSLDRGSELYDDDFYADDFGERINEPALAEDDLALDDQVSGDSANAGLDQSASDLGTSASTNTTAATANDASKVEDGFRESIDSPHVGDQLQDKKLGQEAASDYQGNNATPAESKDESLLDKAKDKLGELTGKDKNE